MCCIEARAQEPQVRHGLQPALVGEATSRERCWQEPTPQTLEEVAKVYQNQLARESGENRSDESVTRAVLALSDARMKTAYAAGLLVGWGETGKRPRFRAVTAAGVSAIIAPLAFLGAEGDPIIADIFACEAKGFDDMARHAASYLNGALLEKIAQRHEEGARLLVALPGSAARPESAWDLGAIAATRHPNAARYIKTILLAAIDRRAFIDPADVPIPSGRTVTRSAAFRQIGSGEPFLLPDPVAEPYTAYYLIHSGVLFPDEGEAYMSKRRDGSLPDTGLVRAPVAPAYEFFVAAQVSWTKTSPTAASAVVGGKAHHA
jgi:hypothetical protein